MKVYIAVTIVFFVAQMTKHLIIFKQSKDSTDLGAALIDLGLAIGGFYLIL